MSCPYMRSRNTVTKFNKSKSESKYNSSFINTMNEGNEENEKESEGASLLNAEEMAKRMFPYPGHEKRKRAFHEDGILLDGYLQIPIGGNSLEDGILEDGKRKVISSSNSPSDIKFIFDPNNNKWDTIKHDEDDEDTNKKKETIMKVKVRFSESLKGSNYITGWGITWRDRSNHKGELLEENRKDGEENRKDGELLEEK